jgi:hypothetical protein
VKILVAKDIRVLYVRKIVRGSWGKIACNKDSIIVKSFAGCEGTGVPLGRAIKMGWAIGPAQ